MAQILEEFTVKTPPGRVFDMFATADGLNRWLDETVLRSGQRRRGIQAVFWSRTRLAREGPRSIPGSAFELEMTSAHEDWQGTRVGCELEPNGKSGTLVRFYHAGWPQQNEHWRISCRCWAMYLRLLRRYLEHGEFVPYEQRLGA